MSAFLLWIGRTLFLLLLYMFLYRLYRALMRAHAPERFGLPSRDTSASADVEDGRGRRETARVSIALGESREPGAEERSDDPKSDRRARVVLEAIGKGGGVWIEEGTGKRRRLDRGSTISLDNRLDVGRSPGNTVRVLDPFVSSRHFIIARGDDGFYLEDLATTNGTLVDENPVRGKSSLRSGAVIQVGLTRFRFEVT